MLSRFKKGNFANGQSNQSGSKYSDPTVNPSSSEFEVNNWLISDFILDKIIPVAGTHPFPLSELTLMVAATTRFKPAMIFEWGTHIGKSARIFHEVTKAFGIKSHIYSIDLPDDIDHAEHPQEKRGMLVQDCDNVTLVQGDGLDDTLRIVSKNKSSINKTILVFIDGDHSYESVKREFGTLIKKLPNAVFLLHDTFYQSIDSGYNVGPHDAIEEVLSRQNKKYKLVKTNTGLPGMTLVYPKSMAKP